MSDEDATTTETTPDPDETALAAEVDELTRSPQEQQSDKVKGALIAAKRSEKALAKRIKELEPIAARTQEIEAQLTSAQPVINAILTNPRLRAEALRIASGEGTRTSSAGTDQPDQDEEAIGHAEDYGMYLADGVTPDAARARRALNRITGITGKQTDERIRPLAGVTLSQKASENIREAMAMTDDDGVQMATEQSIREVAAQLPPQLLADPKVVDLVLNSAIGLDRRNKRTPKAAPEPLYLERQGGSRRPVDDRLSADERSMIAKLGVTEDEYKRAGKQLAAGGRGGIELGSKR
jgi:hypothetical protein